MNHKGTKAQRPISKRLRFALMLCAFVSSWLPLVGADIEYAKVEAVFQKHCLDCHNAKDAEGQLILESYDLLMKGGETGPALVPGKSAESILIKSVQGTFEKDGKRKIMPPGSKRKKLDPQEIASLQTWIDAGAKGPSGPAKRLELVVPKIPLTAPIRRPINSLAFQTRSNLLAVARYGEVQLLRAETLSSKPRVERMLQGHRGNVNAVLFSSDGAQLFAVAGEAGIFGEVRQWNVADGQLVRLFEGHQDAIYSAALSPDGRVLATGSYDQKIKLWDIGSGAEIRTLSGHNGAVFGLAFRPDGKILASASADRTVKLWNVETGKRTDTLSQPLKEQYSVVFDADGGRLFAGGADSRIRTWQISQSAVETSNPLLDAHFAHEGTILRLVLAPDGSTLLSCAEDRTVKLWDARLMVQKQVLDKQPDWISAAAFLSNERIALGRLDGSLNIYDVTTGKAMTGATLQAEAK